MQSDGYDLFNGNDAKGRVRIHYNCIDAEGVLHGRFIRLYEIGGQTFAHFFTSPDSESSSQRHKTALINLSNIIRIEYYSAEQET